MTVYAPTLLADFYKVSHREQYPPGTERVYSTWIARASRIPSVTQVVAFGFQAFIRRWLVDYFAEHFFARSVADVCGEYETVIRHTLGVTSPDSSHIEALHALGYLPLEIKAVPEGTPVPLRVPMLTIENTEDAFFWLTNYVETLFSAEVWQPCTAATLARAFRDTLDFWCAQTGGDLEFVPFQGHDFSMRGMTGVDAAALSGMGHLLSFVGTDTIPAILAAQQLYDADITAELVGTSIPATEHSVMCAGGAESEFETYDRLVSVVYPDGYFSVVSDTWDLWAIVSKGGVLDRLKNKILARNGKVVVRPDSGDPADIICGDSTAPEDSPARKGVVECLWEVFGGTTNPGGFRQLDDHIGVIYGDAITLDRCEEICQRLANKQFTSTNMVYGIGSFTYQHVTRDTFSFALKSTWVKINGEGRNIYKDPITDNGTKKSLTGRVSVTHGARGELVVIDGQDEAAHQSRGYDLLRTVFLNGKPYNEQTFAEIRSRLASYSG